MEHIKKLHEVFEALSTIKNEKDSQEYTYQQSRDRYDLGLTDGLNRAVLILESFIKHNPDGKEKEQEEKGIQKN